MCRTLGNWLLWLWLGLGLAPAALAQTSDPSQVLRTASRDGVVVSSETVALPDPLPRALQGDGVRVAYRWQVPASDLPPGERSLWLFRVGAPYTLNINGRAAHPRLPLPTRADAVDAVFNGRGPVLFELTDGPADIELVLAAPPFMPHGIVQVRHGSAGQLAMAHALARADMAGPVAVMVVLGGALFVLGGLLWLASGRDTLIGLQAALNGTLALRYQLTYLTSRIDLPPLLFEHLNTLAVLACSLLSLSAVWTLTNRFTPARRRWLWGVTGLMLAVSVPALWTGQGLVMLRSAAYLLMLVVLVVIPVHLIGQRDQLKPAWRWALALGHLMLGLGAVHDLGFVLNYTPVTHGTMLIWGWAAVVLAYALVTADHVLEELKKSRASEAELERRVEEARAELQATYNTLAEHEKRTAVLGERAHIMRELHDSLGAQLVTALRGVERDALDKNALVHALEDSLSDLRELLSTRHYNGHLASALAGWRHHWAARLARAGVEVEWDVAEGVEAVSLKPETLHQLLRIVQESATNTLKHSRARRFRVEAGVDGEGLCLRLRDDGQGFAVAQAAGDGQGLAGMQARARQMGARLSLDNGPAPWGACVKVVLPTQALQSTTST